MKFSSLILCAATILVAAPVYYTPAFAQEEVVDLQPGKKKGKKKATKNTEGDVATYLPGKPATKADLSVGDDLMDTLMANIEGCVGMAANMIGVHKNIIVFHNGLFPEL